MQNVLRFFLLFLLFVPLSSCTAVQSEPLESGAEAKETSVHKEEAASPEKKEFPKLQVEYPDGTVYESTDGGENWTKDGEETQRPLVYAALKGECPLCWSGDAYLTIYNGSVPSLIEKGVWFLREENGEWIEAEYLEEVEVLAASAYVIDEKAEGRFKIPPELYVPFEGKCRYIHEMRDFDNEIYTVSAEFSVVGEPMESVSP